MDRYTAVPRIYQPHETRGNSNWKLVDRFGRSPMAYTHNLSGIRRPLYHNPLEAKWRVKALNAGHLRAWIETNHPAIWFAYWIQRKPRLDKEVESRYPYTDPDIKDRQAEFGAWLERERPGLVARFKAFNERVIKKYEQT